MAINPGKIVVYKNEIISLTVQLTSHTSKVALSGNKEKLPTNICKPIIISIFSPVEFRTIIVAVARAITPIKQNIIPKTFKLFRTLELIINARPTTPTNKPINPPPLNRSLEKNHKKIVTISAVRPPARFGSLSLSGSDVTRFKEKTQLGESWINGGFFVINPRFFKFLKGDDTVLESSPLEKVTDLKEIKAFKHEGFWQCMDTKRDKIILEKSIKQKKYKI